MLPRKAFGWESVVRLLLGLVLGYMGVALAAGALGPWIKSLSAPHQMIANLLLGSLAFHGAILAAIIWVLTKNGDTWADVFGVGATPTGKAIRTGILAGLVATPVAIGLQIVTGWVLTLLHFEPVEQQVVENLRDANSLGDRLCFAVVTLVLAPAAEELFFRGVLYASLKRAVPRLSRIFIRAWVVPQDGGQKRRRMAAGLLAATRAERGRRNAARISMVVVSLLFAVIHGNLLAVVPLFALAMILSRLYEKTGNILAPIMAHSLFNSANFLFIVLNVDF